MAHELGLVDEISTSDDLVVAACKDKTVLAIHYVQKKKLSDKLAGVAGKSADRTGLRFSMRRRSISITRSCWKPMIRTSRATRRFIPVRWMQSKPCVDLGMASASRLEEHTSELQSR